MPNILMDLRDRDAVVRAIEQNAAELFVLMGEAGGGEERRDGRLRWTVGGSPLDYHNCVVDAALNPGNADGAIREFIASVETAGVAGSWHLGPSMSPLDLGDRLLRHGFRLGGSEPGMAVELSRLGDVARPAGLRIERVRTGAQLDTWAATLAVDFGEGELEAQWVRQVYERLGLGDDAPVRHYLGLLDRTPVATSTLFLGAGVAGVYFVATVPAARRRGIGSAISAAALEDARRRGYHVGVLGASPMGAPIYEQMGFQAFCVIDIYEYRPASAT